MLGARGRRSRPGRCPRSAPRPGWAGRRRRGRRWGPRPGARPCFGGRPGGQGDDLGAPAPRPDSASRAARGGDERPGLHRVAGEVALALERLQVVVHAVGGADVERLADLADGGRVALLLDLAGDEAEHLELSIGQAFHGVTPPERKYTRRTFRRNFRSLAALPGRGEGAYGPRRAANRPWEERSARGSGPSPGESWLAVAGDGGDPGPGRPGPPGRGLRRGRLLDGRPGGRSGRRRGAGGGPRRGPPGLGAPRGSSPSPSALWLAGVAPLGRPPGGLGGGGGAARGLAPVRRPRGEPPGFAHGRRLALPPRPAGGGGRAPPRPRGQGDGPAARCHWESWRWARASRGAGAPGAAAFVAAVALAGAAFLAASLSALGDVAVARAALAGESAGAGAAPGRRWPSCRVRRPASAVVLAVWLAAGLAAGSAQGVLGALRGASPAAARGCSSSSRRLLLAVLAALVAAGGGALAPLGGGRPRALALSPGARPGG